MVFLKSIHTNKITLSSKLEPSQYIMMLILSLTYTNKVSKKNLITWLNLVSLNHIGPLNGHPLPSLFQKKMDGFGKSLTCAHLTK